MTIWLRVLPLAASLVIAACAQPPSAPPTPWQSMTLGLTAYDGETQDYLIAPGSSTIRTDNFEAPTPTKIVGAEAITTPDLRALMVSPNPPSLIDVLGGKPTTTLPGAVWWPWAGLGTALNDDVQTKFGAALATLSGGDKKKPIVIFCLSKTCWLSHNAVLRAVSLGYQNVYWYRGGRNAWTAAGLPLLPIAAGAM